MTKIYKVTLTILIIAFTFSCNEQKVQLTNHKVADLKNTFPLPTEYKLISGDDVLNITRNGNIPENSILRDKMNTKQTHFAKNKDINNLITITNSLPRIEIEKGFLNAYSQMIEEGTFKKVSEIKNYKIIEKKLLKAPNNNKSLKVKYEFENDKGKRYFSFYLITTDYESFMVTNFTDSKVGIQNSVIKYLKKN